MLDLLYEADRPTRIDLPAAVAERYPGDLGFERPRTVANFVSTLDGVVAIPGVARANRLIADENDDDRFVMGLLRAVADTILIGSGTLQGSPGGLWTAESAYPEIGAAWAELRQAQGMPDLPGLAVVTGSGMIDPAHPAFERGAMVLTTDQGARVLRGRLPAASEVVPVCEGPLVDMRLALQALRKEGREVVVAEAGPHVMGSMLAEGLVDELFLTLSPLVAGRSETATRLGFAEGTELLPGLRVAGTLVGARRQGSHLFLHYDLG